jgi:hypothetical protein
MQLNSTEKAYYTALSGKVKEEKPNLTCVWFTHKLKEF